MYLTNTLKKGNNMKARVIETGEILEITKIEDNLFIDNHYCPYEPYEIEWEINDNDYWARLEHQYAGMAMQGFLAGGMDDTYNRIAEFSIKQAHALVEKLKESK